MASEFAVASKGPNFAFGRAGFTCGLVDGIPTLYRLEFFGRVRGGNSAVAGRRMVAAPVPFALSDFINEFEWDRFGLHSRYFA